MSAGSLSLCGFRLAGGSSLIVPSGSGGGVRLWRTCKEGYYLLSESLLQKKQEEESL